MIYRVLAAAVVFLLLSGGVCEMVPNNYPLEYRDILGTYDADYSAGLMDRIVLRDDSTYVRYFTTFDNVMYADTGRFVIWFGYEDARRPGISLYNFVNRFTVDPNCHRVYSNDSDAVLDTTHRDLECNIRFSPIHRQIGIERSGQLGQYYDKTEAWEE